jgi:hypothetical protein
VAIDFPNSPSVGQELTVGDRTWRWDGTAWSAAIQAPVPGPTGPTGPVGPTGNIDALSDVVIDSATAGEVLKYNGTAWINESVDYTAEVIAAAGGDGTNGQAITTDGNGVLNFTTIVGTTEASIISAVGADGTDGQVLKTNGNGNLSFGDYEPSTSQISGGTPQTIQFYVLGPVVDAGGI